MVHKCVAPVHKLEAPDTNLKTSKIQISDFMKYCQSAYLEKKVLSSAKHMIYSILSMSTFIIEHDTNVCQNAKRHTK